MGIASLTLIISTLLVGSVSRVFVIGECLIITTLIPLSLAHKRSLQSQQRSTDEPKAPYKHLAFVFLALAVLQVIVFLALTLQAPQGYGDAIYLWNMKARFLFRSGIQWKETFDIMGGLHADYPLLLPGNIVRMWSYAGTETILAAPLCALLFSLGTVALLVSSLSTLRGTAQGLVGGLFLLSTPFFISHSASQYADVPFGFYVLSSIVLLNFSDRIEGSKVGPLVTAGITAGFAVWTKNEGLLLLLAIIGALLLSDARSMRPIKLIRKPLLVLAGALPILLVAMSLKLISNSKNDLVDGQGIVTIRRLFEISRYWETISSFFIQSLRVDSIPIAVLPVYAVLLKIERVQLKNSGFVVSVIALFTMVIGYFFVYITTPHDLGWHLKTSLDRLMLQLWPSAIFLFLLVVSRPISLIRATHNQDDTIRPTVAA